MAREQRSGSNGGSGGSGGSGELGRFLKARRARVTPADVGLPQGPGLRRTPGLRREELATLAGVSIDYYTRLERGRETNPSPSVVDALAAALLLDEPERRHLRDLAACAARGSAPERASGALGRAVDPGMELLLESMRPNPAHIVSRAMDLLASNPGGLRLMAGLEAWPQGQRNIVRYVFLHPTARVLFEDWENQIRGCVARLRTLAGVEPDAPDLTGLVDELLAKSPDFARLWERYDVKGHSRGRKTFHHPDAGTFTLGYHSFQVDGGSGQRMVAYHAAPGTPEYDVMVRLDRAPDRDRDREPAVAEVETAARASEHH
ncbi:helix-turn-helix transcriptional regulator [Streptomyces sp. NBC_01275]|uniref:helix-turn-helix transcriptional regulator n=1 Tax=Streptomyces sp. NBC_01275 TaxID=2903807 RepID=UPI0022550973|nr:helix-turn-helix transcriptional regulator [Streptomyces sp. NBC_01275]MCX4765839.1 helix-turn-helix transcriptional regulator [Streptomyces sp. NBC_01275]